MHPFSIHSSLPSSPRSIPSIVHRTTIQTITITTRKDNSKLEEEKKPSGSSPASSQNSPTSPVSSSLASSPLSPPPQPSLLATLLARKRSSVTVPASTEVSPPPRGSSSPSHPDRLPYLPHSPFHLFSYDLDEEPSAPVKESPKPTSPRSERRQDLCLTRCFSCFLFDSSLQFSLPFLFIHMAPLRISLHDLSSSLLYLKKKKRKNLTWYFTFSLSLHLTGLLFCLYHSFFHGTCLKSPL